MSQQTEHIQFFNHPNVSTTFLHSLQIKCGMIEKEMKTTCPVASLEIPDNILDKPIDQDTSVLVVTCSSRRDLEKVIDWFEHNEPDETNEQNDQTVDLHVCLHLLLIIVPEDTLVSVSRILNDETKELNQMKDHDYLNIWRHGASESMRNQRSSYLYVPDLLKQEKAQLAPLLQQHLDLPTELERHNALVHWAMTSLHSSQRFNLSQVVGWLACHWCHIMPTLTDEQNEQLYDRRNSQPDVQQIKQQSKQERNRQHSEQFYFDLDWTPEHFVSGLLLL